MCLEICMSCINQQTLKFHFFIYLVSTENRRYVKQLTNCSLFGTDKYPEAISGFLQFNGNFVDGQNNSKCHNCTPLRRGSHPHTGL